MNNPLIYVDPSGHWIETAFDMCFAAYSWYDFGVNPSLSKFGWAVVDTVGAVLPFIPSSGYWRHLDKLDDIAIGSEKLIEKNSRMIGKGRVILVL